MIVTFLLSPLLFQINAEFKRITTVPLQSKFLSQLDLHSENLARLFEKRGGQLGEKLKRITAQIANASNTGFTSIIFVKWRHTELNEDNNLGNILSV